MKDLQISCTKSGKELTKRRWGNRVYLSREAFHCCRHRLASGM